MNVVCWGYRLAYMENEDLTTLQGRLKSARAEAKLSQKALAKLGGMSQPTYSDLENGISKSTAKIVELAKALGVNAIWLATGEGERKGKSQIIEYPGLTGEQNLLLAAADGLTALEIVELINKAAEIKRSRASPQKNNSGGMETAKSKIS